MRRGAGNGMPCQSGEGYIPKERCKHRGRMGGRQYRTVFSKMTVRYGRDPLEPGAVWQVYCEQHLETARERRK